MPSRSKSAAVRLDIDGEANVIVLEVLLRGKKGLRLIKMVLDTGASLCTIPSETALAIGCDPSKPSERIEMITASGTEYVPVIIIPSLKFLGFELKNVKAACLNLPPKALVSGLLGLNVLSKFNISMAFLKKLLEISR